MKRKLFSVLLISLFLFTALPVGSSHAAAEQKVLLIHDSSDPYGETAYGNASKALEYAKITFDTFDLNQQTALGELGEYGAVATATENLYRLSGEEALKIKQYVADGGGLAVLYRTWHPILHEVFGIYNRREPDFLLEATAVRFDGDFFPGAQGVVVEESLVGEFSFFDVLLLDSTKVLASSIEKGWPIVWLNSHDQGRVIYWNTDWLAGKEFRGYIVQSVLAVQPAAASSIINVADIDIDDFPAPASMQKRDPVGSEFDLNVADFYQKVWYPDMMEIAERFDLKYTWIIPFNYNARVTPPYDDYAEWLDAKIDVNGQKVPITIYYTHLCAQNGEIALHGYNHDSLLLRNWGSVANMYMALESAVQRWKHDSFGPMPVSYIPPNNLYDAAGMEALHQAFPSVEVVAGVDFAPFEGGGNREFGPEPWNEEIFAFPRWSDGYGWLDGHTLNNDTLLTLASGIGMFGLWTHFVHPDDVINTPTNYPDDDPLYIRNPQEIPWRGEQTGKNGMYYGFIKLFEYVEERYPWLRYMTKQEAYYEFQDYLPTEVSYDFSNPAEISISYSKGKPGYLWVRLNDGRKVDLMGLDNAQIVHIYEGDGYNVYVLRAIGEEVRIGLLAP
jgi:hypothetical protein